MFKTELSSLSSVAASPSHRPPRPWVSTTTTLLPQPPSKLQGRLCCSDTWDDSSDDTSTNKESNTSEGSDHGGYNNKNKGDSHGTNKEEEDDSNNSTKSSEDSEDSEDDSNKEQEGKKGDNTEKGQSNKGDSAEKGSSLHSPKYSWRIPGLPGRTTRNPPGILVILPTAIVHQMFHSWLFFLQEYS
jgi:hypothetical protein